MKKIFEVDMVSAAIFERSNRAMLLFKSPESNVIANPVAAKMFDDTPNFSDRTMEQLFVLGADNLIWRDLEKHSYLRGEAEAIRFDGSLFDIEFEAYANLTPDHHLLVFNDITDSRKAEESARAARATVESCEDAIYSLDLETTIVNSWNLGAENLYGYSSAEIKGRSARLLVPIDRDDEMLGFIERLKSGKSIKQYETVRTHKDGKKIYISATLSPIKDRSQQIQACSVIERNIGDRRALEDSLRQAGKMNALGQLAGGVAHDFANLLTIIIGHSELLIRKWEKTGDTVAVKKMKIIRDAGDRAVKLIRQLLTFSRTQATEPVVLNLNEQIVETEKMLKRLIGENIEVVCNLSPDLDKVKLDPGQIEQVLMNLVINARDAMPSGGKIKIETANIEVKRNDSNHVLGVNHGRYVKLSVSDSGTGMEKATVERLFEPFFTTKPIGKGTGLGLSLIYGIAKQCRGSVTVQSEVGHGSTFEVFFPATNESRSNRPELARSRILTGTETVLVVEDDAAIRELLEQALIEKGYKTIVAFSGEDALLQIRNFSGQIDLLVTDVILSGLSGPELSKYFRARKLGGSVLYISGFPAVELTKEVETCDQLNLLQKPFSSEVFLQVVRETLDRMLLLKAN